MCGVGGVGGVGDVIFTIFGSKVWVGSVNAGVLVLRGSMWVASVVGLW